MKSILSSLQHESCRQREITENEEKAFHAIHHLQRYFPALNLFGEKGQTFTSTSELPSLYSIQEWIAPSTDRPRIWTAFRKGENEPCHVFTKIVHLLHPADVLKQYYRRPVHPFLPQCSSSWERSLRKLHHPNNQAYVDTMANFLLSRFREENQTPHGVLFYGAYTGIHTKYVYNLSSEYDSFRQHRWFWKGLQEQKGRLTLIHDAHLEKTTRYQELYQEITTCPLDILSDSSEDEEEIKELDPLDKDSCKEEVVSVGSIESVCFDDLEEEEDTEDTDDTDDTEDKEDNESFSSSDLSDHCNGVDVGLELPDIPVMIIAQEAQDGVMDELMDEEELDGHERGSSAWEARWTAWLFQIVAHLSFLQNAIQFVHNDLHTHNIVWRKTDQKFIYYRSKDRTLWRVPTYGKIFSLIDFGRATFRLGRRWWISDDLWPEEDAGDQYNFGPFYDSSKPKVMPNPSFDLSRLSTCLLDGLFDDVPRKKKGKNPIVLSEEGSWKVYETVSPLYNLLWSWTVDDAGRTVYETKDGEERYDGFELYIRIAHDVHTAVPKEQLHKPLFHPFLWEKKVPEKETLYSVGV